MKDDITTISVPLTVEERADRADIMAGLVGQIAAIKAQAKAKAFEFREMVEALMDRLEEHARVLRAGEENRSQLDLTFPQEQAARALHDVVEHAECNCEGGPESETKSPACPVHGVDSRGPNPAKCDGNHAQSEPCSDPECWLIEGPADDSGAEVAADYVVPDGVDVGTVEEPKSVADFHEAKKRRRGGREASA